MSEAQDSATAPLHDITIHPRFKLAALWTSVMFCYVYGDIFDLFRADRARAILAGRTAIGATTEEALFGFAVMLSIPALMIALSLMLGARTTRTANIVAGALYTLIIILTVPGSWWFNHYLGVIEISLTLTIMAVAWRWPREAKP